MRNRFIELANQNLLGGLEFSSTSEVRAEGEHNGITWVPSVGWEFSVDTWDTWRKVTFTIDNEEDAKDTKSILITHEVWATQQWCPLHECQPDNLKR